jgi:redox-sensitive bicupin YhaK (pirin superfamily)
MTAGRGIVHSERAPPDLRGTTYDLHGLQLWAALPLAHEATATAFLHTGAAAIPAVALPGIALRVLVGSAFGAHSPVATFAPTLYLDVNAGPGAMIELPVGGTGAPFERAVYSVDRDLVVDGTPVPAFTMAIIAPGSECTVAAPEGARYAVIGGAPLDAPRFLWWNFASSRKERIEQAKADWAAERMGQIPGETERIPLPPR